MTHNASWCLQAADVELVRARLVANNTGGVVRPMHERGGRFPDVSLYSWPIDVQAVCLVRYPPGDVFYIVARIRVVHRVLLPILSKAARREIELRRVNCGAGFCHSNHDIVTYQCCTLTSSDISR